MIHHLSSIILSLLAILGLYSLFFPQEASTKILRLKRAHTLPIQFFGATALVHVVFRVVNRGQLAGGAAFPKQISSIICGILVGTLITLVLVRRDDSIIQKTPLEPNIKPND